MQVGTGFCASESASQTWSFDGQRLSVAGGRCLSLYEDVPPGETEAWVAPLSTGKFAVLLLNRGTASASVTLPWADLGPGVDVGTVFAVRDVWAHTVRIPRVLTACALS